MIRVTFAALVVSVALLGTSACGARVDLSKGLEVIDVLTGYYDAGLKDGWNYLKPSMTFRLRNTTAQTIDPAQITVAFWQEGVDSEWDSHLMQAIRSGGLASGTTTESLVARTPNVGLRLEGPRAGLFGHSSFKDVTARVFAKQGGNIYPLGRWKIDRVVIPHMGN